MGSTCIAEEVQIDGQNPAIQGIRDAVLSKERVTVSSHLHVLLPLEGKSDWAAAAGRSHRNGAVQKRSTGFLPAKTASEALCLRHNLVHRHTQHV